MTENITFKQLILPNNDQGVSCAIFLEIIQPSVLKRISVMASGR